ncbi:MAG: hypothetical protein IJ617_01225 [Oscillospiraceae bacterium]|nr:hypothetical protein [Oscillospiraceae bacterium]
MLTLSAPRFRRPRLQVDSALRNGELLLLVMLAAGVLAGGVVGFFSLQNGDAGPLEDYVASRFLCASLPTALLNASGFFLLLGAAATSYLGVLALPVVVFLRGYLLSCAVSGLYALFSLRGLGCALLLRGIPGLLVIPCFYCAACAALASSRRLLSLRLGQPGPAARGGLGCIPLSAGVVLFDAFYGYYIVPAMFSGF